MARREASAPLPLFSRRVQRSVERAGLEKNNFLNASYTKCTILSPPLSSIHIWVKLHFFGKSKFEKSLGVNSS